MDSAQRRLAERRLLAALKRLHRREPMRADFRADAVLREARADPGERHPASHRGGGSLRDVSDTELLDVVDGLATFGNVVRSGRGVRLAEHEPLLLDPEMRDRVARLLADLSNAGAEPPRLEPAASRLGIPAGLIAQLRSAGELVHVADGMDYPRGVAEELVRRLDTMSGQGPLSVSRVRDELGISRRRAEAWIAYRTGVRRDATG
jgi:hypothetical protein